MRSKLFLNASVKKIFKRDTEFTNKCKICDMKFDNPERTKRHMIKAHSKPKREKRE